ncbi:MAG: formyl transferase [Gammaproteobacteria bacterium]|nr:formyl transferase [Gammaproteobacteria bacterium]
MDKLRIMVLCGQSPRHLYVANTLCSAASVLAVVHETGGEWNTRKLLKKLRPDNLARKVWRWLRDRRRYTGNQEEKFFFGDNEAALKSPDLVREVPHINHPDVVRLADELQPDLIAVFGTSLIRGELLRKGRLGMINLHGGLSPEYRGSDCTFWALYNGEPEKVGCTIHYIDAGIDTGRLIAHVSPEVYPEDDELTLFWRSVKESATVYAELMQRLAQGDKLGEVQSDKGRLYLFKRRGLRHEQKVNCMLQEGLLKDKKLGLRVRWFGNKA